DAVEKASSDTVVTAISVFLTADGNLPDASNISTSLDDRDVWHAAHHNMKKNGIARLLPDIRPNKEQNSTELSDFQIIT
ncbi:MAG: hypothetical protein RR903_04005, partial [Edwardsiella sp. (in: enterobacteria)]